MIWILTGLTNLGWGRFSHTWVFASALVAVTAYLPITRYYEGDPGTTNTINVGFPAIGVAAIATGIFDHRLLVRTFGSARDLNLENTHAGA
ncbi:MAG: hypothetical protein M3Q18_14095 [Actinomycetota bacterium]|nr:hypothetical protein [Actinomycetota bacterium]